MFSSSRIPLFVVSLLLASVSLVESHDFSLHQRDHANLKRLIKKRSPFPQDSGGGLLGGLAGAGNLPDLPGAGGTSVSTTTTSTSTTSGSSTTSVSFQLCTYCKPYFKTGTCQEVNYLWLVDHLIF